MRRGILLGAGLALACLAFFVLRRGAPAVVAKGAPAAAAGRAPRGSRALDVASRPRAGIAGHVRDGEGKPVPTAQVCAWAEGANGLVTRQRAPRCARVDGGGAYALADLFPGTPMVVSASAPRFAPVGYRGPDGAGEVRLGEGEKRAGVDIVLGREGVALRGSVGDITGGAVSGAFVLSEDGPNRAVTRSDAKGEFLLWVEPGPARVEATAEGYAPGAAAGPAPEHFFKIRLVPGATLVGRTLVTGSDEAVAGVFVEGVQMEGGWARASTRSDEEGRFRIEGLTPGRYRVEGTSEGRQGYSPSSTTLGMGETSTEIRVDMDPAFVVRGRVVDKASGAPCASGQVTITDTKQNEYSQAAIDPDGSVRMASVLPGTYRVEIACKDHLSRDAYPKVTVTDRDAPPLTWEVDKGASVRVEVVDAQRRPVTKASVTAYGTGPEMSSGDAEQADADGAFHLAGLKAGEYSVSARLGEGGEARTTITVAQDREERVALELPPSGTVEGVVEDATHRPVGNVQVIATGSAVKYARSLDDGTFSLGGLPAGDYEVRAGEGMPQGAPDDGRSAKITVTAAERARVKLTIEARDGVIQGRVVDGAGSAVTDAFVDFALTGEGGGGVPRYDVGHPPVLTDTEGHFTVDGLADGEYGLRASRRGGAEASADHVKAGTRDLVITLDAGASIAGTLSSGNAPVERFTVTARHKQGGFQRSELFFHAGGAFDLRDLPAGAYDVDAETPLGRATAEIVLAEGEHKAGVTLALTLRGSVDGRLVSLDDGAPIAGMRLGMTGNSDAAALSGDGRDNVSGPDGRFHLEGALPGQWSLLVYSADPAFESASVPITVQEGGGTSDVGAVRVPRRRLAPGDPRGFLGVFAGPSSESGAMVVNGASGPAAEAGIQAGDVIVSVDGFDVQGANQYLYTPLTVVPAGRAVTLGLGRGGSVSVVARGF